MGENPTETLSEIEASRQRLQQDIDLLAARLPEADELERRAKIAGAIAAAAGIGLTVAYVSSKRALENRRRHKEAERQAEALADVLAERRFLVQEGPTADVTVELDDDARQTLTLAALAAAVTAMVVAVARAVSRRGD
ncbi:MAG: hypothetical protein R3343_00990 [Nitriliruptorales bacterium]|nr:hypothetical protein [Nitriliruptorales bacterium]